MKTYRRRLDVIAWQYDTEEFFWKWTHEAKFALGFDTTKRLLGLEINVFSDFGLEKTFLPMRVIGLFLNQISLQYTMIKHSKNYSQKENKKEGQ